MFEASLLRTCDPIDGPSVQRPRGERQELMGLERRLEALQVDTNFRISLLWAPLLAFLIIYSSQHIHILLAHFCFAAFQISSSCHSLQKNVQATYEYFDFAASLHRCRCNLIQFFLSSCCMLLASSPGHLRLRHSFSSVLHKTFAMPWTGADQKQPVGLALGTRDTS